MKIALIGYGKMGQAIEAIALERGHTVVLKINIDNLSDFTKENISKADVAIEFTGPESAVHNIMGCFEAHVPVVCGSTGWLKHLPEVESSCKTNKVGFLYASNFSLGVNIFFEVNTLLAKLMAGHKEYNIQLTEVHHTAKLDAPSGTAISLAEQILTNNTHKKSWYSITDEAEIDTTDHALPILSKRIDPAPGTHTILYSSDIDDIEITHTAHNRKGFALGAVVAAEYMNGKKGMHTMKDVLKLH
jgi:4-hydroxy-tetrahydrodipicolinate reductase